jgi:NitT/TauT family transport system ATP-binding protein
VEVLSAEKTYPNGIQALLPVDLTIEEGEFVTLLGPSGCGKSTLLKMVAGLLEPTDGQLHLWRKPVARLGESGKKMAFVFQSPTLMPWASVQTNVRLPLDLAGVPRQEADAQVAEAQVAEALALVGLSTFAAALPRALSGGMQMRVSIARGLVTQPDLLLMDEPFGALDEMTRERLNLELLRIWEASRSTVIFVTHSISEAVFLSTRVVVMSPRPGRITGIVDVDLPQPRTVRTREEPRFAELIRDVRRTLRAGGGFEAEEDVDEEQLIVAEEGL